MPTYLLHGFRWPRPLIRIHIILQNLDDAAAEWLVAPETTQTLLDNFNELYPESMQHLERLRFVEQYDPSDLSAAAASQPYAYVADVCEEVKLSVPINEVTQRGVPNEQWIALMELKDKIAPEEEVGWFIVVCGDEERYAPPSTDDSGSQTAIAPSSSESSQKAASVRGPSTAKAIADDKQQTKAQAPPPSSMKFRPKSVKDRQRLSLQTQIPPPPPVPEEEEGEAMDEIIAMSPAARQPITSFRKSRSSIALSMVSAGPGNSNSQVNLSGVNLTADTQKPYFGQTINSADLIATGIENAFSRL
ncbi:hypothetical protein BTJ68_03579 [Hortaea werneckii EXF-2000]|uniref:Uncharacterized protein n=1 Tax=Hortaea werneckii EXF-2000 TaxID=1157616 RepID=A0A1Z5TJ62_HORWE|nr:hypothetical protein BTJ68_03579 [Hortaea werneckii EXF-2000]